MRWRLALLGLLVFTACGDAHVDAPLWGDAPAEPIDLRGELSATEVPLLGELEVRLDAYVGPGLEVKFAPTVPPGFEGDVEALPVRPFGKGEWRPFVVHLRPTELGELTIPPFELRAGEDGPAATTAEWTLQVQSVIGEHGEAVEAPAPPFAPRVVIWPWLVGAGAVLLLGALLWWWSKRTRVRVTPVEIAVPPHIKALRALARLRNAPRATTEQVEAFYVEVSGVLRTYLEERFGLHAPERTTEEFLVEVEADTRLSIEQRGVLREFLAQCDLVKFARLLPGDDIHERTFATAEGFVEATRADRVREGAA